MIKAEICFLRANWIKGFRRYFFVDKKQTLRFNKSEMVKRSSSQTIIRFCNFKDYHLFSSSWKRRLKGWTGVTAGMKMKGASQAQIISRLAGDSHKYVGMRPDITYIQPSHQERYFLRSCTTKKMVKNFAAILLLWLASWYTKSRVPMSIPILFTSIYYYIQLSIIVFWWKKIQWKKMSIFLINGLPINGGVNYRTFRKRRGSRRKKWKCKKNVTISM